MKTFKLILVAFASLLLTTGLTSCGGDDSSNSGNSSYSSDCGSNLSEYAGKWQIFEPGDLPGESATLTLTISRNGDAKILLTICPGMGQNDIVIDEGSGSAQLSGTRLYVELTKGKSRGNTYNFVATDGHIYTSDGQEFYRR